MEYFLGSIKIMLIVAGLSAFISMLVAWVIKLLFGVIRRQRVPAAATAAPNAAAIPAAQPGATPVKAA